MAYKKNQSVHKLFIILFCMLLLFNCKKDTKSSPPVPEIIADFNFNKSAYAAGDTVKLINNSVAADSYSLTLTDPDGKTITNLPEDFLAANDFQFKNLLVWLDINAKDGNYTLTPKASRSLDNRTSTISKSFSVVTKRASVLVSFGSPNNHTFYISVDNQPLFQFNGQPGVVARKRFMIPIGLKVFAMRFSAVYYSKTLVLEEGKEYEIDLS